MLGFETSFFIPMQKEAPRNDAVHWASKEKVDPSVKATNWTKESKIWSVFLQSLIISKAKRSDRRVDLKDGVVGAHKKKMSLASGFIGKRFAIIKITSSVPKHKKHIRK